MAKSLKKYRESLKATGSFYTDPKLALKLKSFFPNEIDSIYDPTCGSGNLLSVFDDSVKKYGQELDPAEAQEARQNLVNCEIVDGDTLLNDGFIDRKFKYIVANPPFSVKWMPDQLKNDDRFKVAPVLPPPSKADFAFILHILWHLEEDGIAVVLNSPGILFRGQKEGKIRKWMLKDLNCIERVIKVPSGFFEDTNIETALLILKKNRTEKDTTIIFEDWDKDGETKEVEISKLLYDNDGEETDCNLSVQRQTYKFVPLRSSEEILNDFTSSFLSSFKLQLSLIEELQKDKLDLFVKDIDKVMKDFKKKRMDKDQISYLDYLNGEIEETNNKLNKAVETNDTDIIKDCKEEIKELKEEMEELKKEFIRRQIERKQVNNITFQDMEY